MKSIFFSEKKTQIFFSIILCFVLTLRQQNDLMFVFCYSKINVLNV